MKQLSNRQFHHRVEVSGPGIRGSIGKKNGAWCLVTHDEAHVFEDMTEALAIKGHWNYEHTDHTTIVTSSSRGPLTEMCIWCGNEIDRTIIEQHEEECSE
jgi:hypothetical protein